MLWCCLSDSYLSAGPDIRRPQPGWGAAAYPVVEARPGGGGGGTGELRYAGGGGGGGGTGELRYAGGGGGGGGGAPLELAPERAQHAQQQREAGALWQVRRRLHHSVGHPQHSTAQMR
jgi:hypothetical protein